MNNIINFRNYKNLDVWSDPEDDGRKYCRKTQLSNTICLPPECQDYIKRFGRVYKIELSESKLSWTLTVLPEGVYWDEKGYYIRTLVFTKNGSWEVALERAKKIYPNEAAFYIEEGCEVERLPKDDKFDAWFNKLLRKNL